MNATRRSTPPRHGGPGPTLWTLRFPLPASRFSLLASRFSLLASRFCGCSCGQEPALFHGAPGERRGSDDQPAGAPAGMPAMFVTVQGCTVHEHRPRLANPLRRDAQRARTRGGLSLAYFSLATQREVGRAARRADRKLLFFDSNDRANKRNRGERGAHGGPRPPYDSREGGQPEGPTGEALALRFERRNDEATKRRSKTEASVELMVGQGPPYDSREGGPPEGRIKRSCALLQAASSKIKRSHSSGKRDGDAPPGPSPQPHLRFARALGVIGCHRQPVSNPEPLPRGEGSSAAEQRRAFRRQINGRAAPYPRNCGLTTTAPLDLHQCHPDPLERSIPSTSKGR